MADKIEPALTPEEWADWRREILDARNEGRALNEFYLYLPVDGTGDTPAAIATANDLLPDSDMRKLTHEKLDRLKGNEAFVRALRSFLPPRE